MIKPEERNTPAYILKNDRSVTIKFVKALDVSLSV